MAEFRRGFKAWCENAAAGFRRDLRLPAISALDPRALAQHLKVTIWTPHDVADMGKLAKPHLDQLLIHDPDSWSAVTLILPIRKVIVVNSQHSPERQNSDIMHELSHLILEHEPARVDMTQERLMILDTYDRTQEDEANWLAGALLVPREALLHVLSHNSRDTHVALHFKVSKQMILWRRQTTGVDAQLKRRNSKGSRSV